MKDDDGGVTWEMLIAVAMLVAGVVIGALAGVRDTAQRHCRAQQAEEYTIDKHGRIICVDVTKQVIQAEGR